MTENRKKIIILMVLTCLSSISFFYWTETIILDPSKYSNNSTNMSPTRTEILLLSYGRSGSSFTSSIISNYSDVFFVYEPLAALEYKSKSYYTNTYEYLSRSILNAFFSCDLLEAEIVVFKDIQLRNSRSTYDFYYCFNKMMTGAEHLSCFKKLMNSCRNHTIVFQKTIRFSVKWTEPFFKENPNFALLFLIRDPRATLYSQSKVFAYFNWKKDAYYFAKKHCQRIEDDLREVERLHRLYPQRVRCIRYEDGAMNPFVFAKDIYSYLGLTFSKNVIDYVNISTSSNDNTNIYYTTIRKSQEAMYKWRSVAGYTHVHEVDLACQHLYSKLGYLIVQSKEDLYSNRSLVTTPMPGGIF